MSGSRLLGCGISALATGLAAAQVGSNGTITDGDTVFTMLASPTTATSTGPTGDMRVGGVAGQDHMFQTWWWVRRVGADTRENALFNATSWSYVGNVATLNYNMGAYGAVIRYTVTDRPVPEGGYVRCELTLTNQSANPIDLAVFHYLDMDLNASAGSDSATLIAPNHIRVTEATTTANYVAISPTAWQVTTFATLRGLLTNTAINDLSNTGLPFGPGDWTGSFQYAVNLAPAASATVTAFLAVNSNAPSLCPGDVDGDNDVDLTDLALLLTNFGTPSGAQRDDGDLDGDGDVDLTDLATLLSNFGTACI